MARAELKSPTVESELERVTHQLALDEKEVDPNLRVIKLNEREKNDIRQALRDPAIRRFLFRVLNLAGILASSGDPNPTIMAHHEGRRSIGLEIYRAITDADPGAYWQMQRDADSDRKSQPKENTDAA